MAILKSQVDSAAIQVTFVELINLINTSTLVSGATYALVNWNTTYKLWNGIDYENAPADYSAITIGAGETLLLTAVSNTVLAKECKSLHFPEDEIYIDIVANVDITKSKITYRRDTIKEIEAYYDWRFVKFPRFSIKIDVQIGINSFTLLDEISNTYTTIRYSGWSEDINDYSDLLINQNIGALVTNPHQISQLSTYTQYQFTTTVNINTSKYSHFLTFGDNYATDYNDIKILTSVNGKSTLYSKSNWLGGGNNIVFYKNNTKSTQKLHLNSAYNSTIGNSINNTTFSKCENVISYIQYNECNLSLNNVIISLSGTSIDLNTNIMSINTGNYSRVFIGPWVDIKYNNILNIDSVFLGSGAVNNIAPITISKFFNNTGVSLSNSVFTKTVLDSNYEIISNEFVAVSGIYAETTTFKLNLLKTINNVSIFDLFESNIIDFLSYSTIYGEFIENSILQSELSIINFGSDGIYNKYKDAEISTFETTINITDSNRLNGNLQIQIYDDEIQYIGHFLLTLPTDYTVPIDIEIYSIVGPTIISPSQHRIRLRPIGLLSIFIWNTPPTLTGLLSQTRNIVIENPDWQYYIGRNHDWIELFAEKIETVTCWLQYISMSYDHNGQIMQYGGPLGGDDSSTCCDQINEILDILGFVPITILSYTITNLSGSNPAYYDNSNLSLEREVGERITTFTVSFNINKINTQLSSIILEYIPIIGSTITLYTFINVPTQTVTININPVYLNQPGYFILTATSNQTTPSGGVDTISAQIYLDFKYTIFWALSSLPGPLTQIDIKSLNKLLVSTSINQKITFSSSSFDSYIYFCLPTVIVPGPNMTSATPPAAVGQINYPLIYSNGIITNNWYNYTVSVNLYSTTISYYVIRSEYIHYANTWHQIKIEN